MGTKNLDCLGMNIWVISPDKMPRLREVVAEGEQNLQ